MYISTISRQIKRKICAHTSINSRGINSKIHKKKSREWGDEPEPGKKRPRPTDLALKKEKKNGSELARPDRPVTHDPTRDWTSGTQQDTKELGRDSRRTRGHGDGNRKLPCRHSFCWENYERKTRTFSYPNKSNKVVVCENAPMENCNHKRNQVKKYVAEVPYSLQSTGN